ncbi:MAG: alpha/beta fold hydrolase [Candidatus Margulisiibacteriota bacterium]
MKILNIFHKKLPKDSRPPSPPFYLVAENHFAQKNGSEIFIKKIFSTSLKRKGALIMAPGIACNANLFRITKKGEIYALDHDQSFANLAAAKGFTVYLYHPSYSERVYNRYVRRHCRESNYFGRSYEVSSTLTFDQLVNRELPLLIDYVCKDAQTDSLSWIGFSMGGMLIYAYLSKTKDQRIKNIVTIGSPVSLTQIITRLISYGNLLSKALGFEEKTLMGTISENFVPLTRLIANLPGGILRFNLLAPTLYNPTNISNKTLRLLFGKVVEPIPSGLENSFIHFFRNGFSSLSGDFDYLQAMRSLRNENKNFLFFFGQLDLMAPPDSIRLAHESITPGKKDNLIGVKGAGHIDLIIGHHSQEEVWEPSLSWIEEKSQS